MKDFAEHYRIMAADSDFRFSEEFEDLKHIGREQLCNAADLPVNRPKNRFTNILPYDHSRVKLLPTDDEDGSDYINANYMSVSVPFNTRVETTSDLFVDPAVPFFFSSPRGTPLRGNSS